MRTFLKKLVNSLGYQISRLPSEQQMLELRNQNMSWSQEGEDLILDRYFSNKKSGFYIDVGAHDPFRFSNTYKFYLKSWKGLNIDANPDKLELFNKFRIKDINVNHGVSDSSGVLDFYRFQESALNTFDFENHKNLITNGWHLKDIIRVPVQTLNDILSNFKIVMVDFISIDVEGFDLKVLRGFDLNKYNPEVILIEGRTNEEKQELINYLNENNYGQFAQAINTMFFKKNV